MSSPTVSRITPSSPVSGLTAPGGQEKPRSAPPTLSKRPSAAVALSDRARAAEAQRSILTKALAGMEEQFSQDDLFAASGRAEYLESVSQPTDLSSNATAGRILGGITSYIYGAFRLQHDEIGHEELADFKEQVLRGFERGMGEARQVLGAIDKLDDGLAFEISETDRLVREGLDRFFADETAAINARSGSSEDANL